MSLIADTTVLIDLWRLRRQPARLVDLHERLEQNERQLPWMVFFEFARGHFLRGKTEADIRNFVADFSLLPVTETQVTRAARIAADLQQRGQEIGVCDVWIAAAAQETGLAVLTANVDHFNRVPGMKVIGYTILP